MISILFHTGKQTTQNRRVTGNDIESVLNWTIKTLMESDITKIEKQCLWDDVKHGVLSGNYWRGNISDIWKLKGYTAADIPDLYV